MIIDTAHPVALTSYDYLFPLGAIKDNSRNSAFNAKLKKFPGDVMDLGCAGGGFVKDCLDEGRLAIGLEGNDYGQKNTWAEWATIPENLFTCDITYPFVVHTGDSLPHLFKIITAWEVLEHLQQKDLGNFFKNVVKHLHPDGVFIISIANKPSFSDSSHTIDLHRIHKDENWWTARVIKAGFVRDSEAEFYFGKDWLRNERKSFHFVLRKK